MPYLSPSVLVISYRMPHSLLNSNPVIHSFGGVTVQIPVGFCSSFSRSCIRCSGTCVGWIWAWKVNGHVVLATSSWRSQTMFKRDKNQFIPFEDSTSSTPVSMRFLSLSILACNSGSMTFAVSFLEASGTREGSMRMSMCRLWCLVQHKRNDVQVSTHPGGSANPYIEPLDTKWTPSNSSRRFSASDGSVNSILPCRQWWVWKHRRQHLNAHVQEQ